MDGKGLDHHRPAGLFDAMIADPGETVEGRGYESMLDQLLGSTWFGRTAGDILEAGPLLGGGTKALAAYARLNNTRKRVWATECAKLSGPRTAGNENIPEAPSIGHTDREMRSDAFFKTLEDFSNVRMLPDGLANLGAGPAKFCCAFLRHSGAIGDIKTELAEVWRRLAPGGAMVVQGSSDMLQPLEELVDVFGREEIEGLGNCRSHRLLWAKKTGGPTVVPSPLRRDLPRVVVASYGEDLGWTRDLLLPKTVYDATGSSTLEGVVRIKNQAREAGQYLHHIVSNYPDFHEWEVFLQGRPFDHLSGPLHEVLNNAAEWGEFHPFGPLVPFNERVWVHDEWAAQFAREWFGEVPPDLHWVPGAQFAVNRKVLLSKPLSYWQALQKKILDEKSRSPWAIERLWQAIFRADGEGTGYPYHSSSASSGAVEG